MHIRIPPNSLKYKLYASILKYLKENSIIGIWIKKGPIVNDPILITKFLFISLNTKYVFSLININKEHEYKIHGKFKYPLWNNIIFLYFKVNIWVPKICIKRPKIPKKYIIIFFSLENV